MLTVEQIKRHCEVSVGHDESSNILVSLMPDRNYTRSMARLLYIHNEHASKLRIICPLLKPIPHSEVRKWTEEEVKATIDWERFTIWINKHDDLAENNIVTVEEWADYQAKHREIIGRDGILDTIQKKVVDCHKLVLV